MTVREVASKRSTHEDSDGSGYCLGCGTTIGEEHLPECDVMDRYRSMKVDYFHPQRVMTRDEYDVLKITGLHSVCHDYDGFGNTAVWLHFRKSVIK